MGNVLAANVSPLSIASAYNLTSGNNDGKMLLWKLTRTMKAAGWVYKSSGAGAVPIVTIASGSNGVSLPQATINVSSVAGLGFPNAGGNILVLTSAGLQTVAYSGASGNSRPRISTSMLPNTRPMARRATKSGGKAPSYRRAAQPAGRWPAARAISSSTVMRRKATPAAAAARLPACISCPGSWRSWHAPAGAVRPGR